MKQYLVDYERVQLQVPVGFKAAVEKLARRECRTVSGMIRWITERRLHEEGIPIEPPADQPAASANGAGEVDR